MRIRWTTRLTVIIGLLTIAAGVAARPAHAAAHAQPARTAAAAHAVAGSPRIVATAAAGTARTAGYLGAGARPLVLMLHRSSKA